MASTFASRPGCPSWRILPLLLVLLWPGWSAADDRGKLQELIGTGRSAFLVGDYAQAADSWMTAARLCRLSGDAVGEAEVLLRATEALRRQGLFERAGMLVADAEKVVASVAPGERLELRALLTAAKGALLLHGRRPLEAERLLTESLLLARRNGMRVIRAAAANNLGNVFLSVARPDLAMIAYREAAEAARQTQDTALRATALVNATRAAFAAGEPRLALTFADLVEQQAVAVAPEQRKSLALAFGTTVRQGIAGLGLAPQPGSPAPSSGTRSTTRRSDAGSRSFEPPADLPPVVQLVDRSNRADDVIAEELRSLARRYLTEALALSRSGADARSGSQAAGGLALLQPDDPSADPLLAEALGLAESAEAPELAFRWLWLLGRRFQQAGDTAKALQYFRLGVRYFERISRDISFERPDGSSIFQEFISPLYRDFLSLLLAGQPVGTLDERPYAEVREAVEGLRSTELQDYFGDSCVAQARSKAVDVDAISGDAAIVYPLIFEDRLELIVAQGRHKSRAVVRVDRATLEEQVMLLRASIDQPGRLGATGLRAAQDIYKALVGPLEPFLTAHSVKTIVLVPDGFLRLVPLAALHDGQHFLVEKWASATIPSLTLIEPKAIARGETRILLAGVSEAVQEFRALPGTALELAAISATMSGRSTTLLNGEFTTSAIEMALTGSRFNIVHFASHGEFNGLPEESFVLTYDGKLTLDKLESLMKFGEGSAGNVELLTLSACRTASGDDRAPLGLSGIAVKSGARSAVGSLWYVSDAATVELLSTFYRVLSEDRSISKAEALRRAQLHALNSRSFSHPYFWSPFILVGNWL